MIVWEVELKLYLKVNVEKPSTHRFVYKDLSMSDIMDFLICFCVICMRALHQLLNLTNRRSMLWLNKFSTDALKSSCISGDLR